MKFIIVGKTYSIDKKILEKVAEAAFSLLPEKEGVIEFGFVSQRKIKELNEKYRKIQKETDVLSFQLGNKPLIGQVFICYNVARRQASEFNTSLQKEVELLLAHGILHIFDFDHETESEAKSMEAKEKQILAKVGD